MTHTESRTKFRHLIKTINTRGCSNAFMERSLSLGQGTFKTYLESARRVPADVLSLLEIINTFLWILGGEDDGYRNKSSVVHMAHTVFKDIQGTKDALEFLGRK